MSGQLYTPAASPVQNNTNSYQIGGWLGLRSSLGILETIKIFCPYAGFKPWITH